MAAAIADGMTRWNSCLNCWDVLVGVIDLAERVGLFPKYTPTPWKES